MIISINMVKNLINFSIHWGEKKPSCTICANLNWYNHSVLYGDFFKKQKTNKLGIKLPYDPIIPVLCMYPEKIIIQKDTCALMFTETVFTITRAWKQPKCSSTDE